MKKTALKVLIGLLALAAAWDLGRLAGCLLWETRQQAALSEEARSLSEAKKQLGDELASLQPGSAADAYLRQRGFISKGDIVFFDGG